MIEKKSIRQAWAQSVGPKSTKESLMLFLKGFCMGGADIIPGVSGGTIAFITGIYENLVDAIQSVNGNAISKALRLDVAGVLTTVHARFLCFLLAGIGFAVMTMAKVMHHLLSDYPVLVWSLFFGLIAASILVVGKNIRPWSFSNIAALLSGSVFSYWLVGLIPVQTPFDWWFIMLCGSIAICAMILPGISGAFLLLIMGKYEYITGALKNPFAIDSLTTIGLFGLGCIVGIMLFSRLLNHLLHRYHTVTLAVLTGFMIGAMRKVWPWKDVLRTEVIRGKEYILETSNVLPSAMDENFLFACLLALAGFGFVVVLDKFSGSKIEPKSSINTQHLEK